MRLEASYKQAKPDTNEEFLVSKLRNVPSLRKAGVHGVGGTFFQRLRCSGNWPLEQRTCRLFSFQTSPHALSSGWFSDTPYNSSGDALSELSAVTFGCRFSPVWRQSCALISRLDCLRSIALDSGTRPRRGRHTAGDKAATTSFPELHVTHVATWRMVSNQSDDQTERCETHAISRDAQRAILGNLHAAHENTRSHELGPSDPCIGRQPRYAS